MRYFDPVTVPAAPQNESDDMRGNISHFGAFQKSPTRLSFDGERNDPNEAKIFPYAYRSPDNPAGRDRDAIGFHTASSSDPVALRPETRTAVTQPDDPYADFRNARYSNNGLLNE